MTNPWPESDPAVMAPAEELEELRHVVRAVVAKHADHERVRAAADSERGWSDDLWLLLNEELEISALAVPEKLGGAGFGTRELSVVLEETGAALLPEPILSSAVIGCRALAAADDPAAFEPDLARALAGQRVIAVTLDDPTRSVAGPRAEHADGVNWSVTGTCPRVLQAAAADLLVVRAESASGPVLLLLDAFAADVTPLAVIDRTRRQARVTMAEATARLLVGPERAPQVIERLGLLGRVAVAAEHTGIVGELLDRTTEYVAQREQFGRPVGSFQAIKHRLADVLVDRERARSAVRYAAAIVDDVLPDARLPVAVASAVCADAAMRAAHEAMQLHGGIGFTWEHRAHYYLRRVLGDEGLFGQSREERRVIAELVGV